MRVFAAVMLCILFFGGVGWLAVTTVLENRRRAAIVRAPAGAAVEAGDSRAVVKAKVELYHRYTNAIRLLGEVLQGDAYLTFIPEQLRKDIDDAVKEFYKS